MNKKERDVKPSGLVMWCSRDSATQKYNGSRIVGRPKSVQI